MKKLLIILGAGSSLDFGMPSVTEIDRLFTKWATQYHWWFEKGKQHSLYSWTKELIKIQRTNSNNDSIDYPISFEDVLFEMQSICSIFDNNILLSQFTNRESLPEITNYLGLKGKASSEDFFKNTAFLNDRLLVHMRKLSESMKSEKIKELQLLSNFVKKLKQEFTINVINLNYDNVFLSACPEFETGFEGETGIFNPNSIYESTSDYCYHIHGSVHIDFVDQDKAIWKSDLNSDFKLGSSNFAPLVSSEGNRYRVSSIVLGLDKINQIHREPFKHYFFKSGHLVNEADSILYVGYGFNDNYLNDLIISNLKASDKTRNIVVVDYKDFGYPSLWTGGTNNWGLRLLQTNFTGNYQMGNGAPNHYMPNDVDYYKKRNLFEHSLDPKIKLNVWYNGFIEAIKRPDLIIAHL